MKVYVITHPDVVVDPAVPIPQWPLSERGRERMRLLLARPWVRDLTAVYCSAERKATDGAAILAGYLSLPYTVVPDLGEIDRSSTGYLPHEEHLAAARACFANPEESVRGWETAGHAQRRVVAAVEGVIAGDRSGGDIALVGHGGVSTLYLCRLKGLPIDIGRRPPGATGGYYYVFDAASRALLSDWTRIDPE